MRIGALLAAWRRPRATDAGLALSGSSQHALKTYHLSSIDVFRDLPRSEVERLAETTRMITCERGRVVYRAGESNEALFLLKTGRVHNLGWPRPGEDPPQGVSLAMRVQAVLERTGLWQDRRTYYGDCSTGTKKRLNFARSLLLDAFVEVCRARMR